MPLNIDNFKLEAFTIRPYEAKESEAKKSDSDLLNIKLNSVAKKSLEIPTEIFNAITNYAIKKLSSSKNDLELISLLLKNSLKDRLIEKSNSKNIEYFQKDIDNKFKEIKELKKSSSPDQKRIKSLETSIDLSARAIKTIDSSQIVFRQIAQGKAKMVFEEYEIKDNKLTDNKVTEHKFCEKNVYYAPVGKDFLTEYLRTKEISDEVITCTDIGEKLASEGIVSKNDENYLAIGMEVVKNPESQKNKKYTVKTAAAEGDLKNAIQEGTLKFPDSLRIGLHIVKGMSNLHRAGYVHGDGKNDNVLLVRGKDGKLTGRIADLGKAQKMKSNERGIYVGNSRFAAPEGNLSHSGEIYTTALLIINTLEGEVLKKNGKDMIISPDNIDTKANTEGRFGIEKFLVLNKKCIQTDNSTLNKKVKILGKEIKNKLNSFIGKSNTVELNESQEQTDMYIKALVVALSTEYSGSQKQIEELGDLLLEMTRAKVGEGPKSRTKSLEDIIPRYNEIMTNFTSV